MVSPDGTLIDVHVKHLMALMDVTGKQTYPSRLTSSNFRSVMRTSVTECVRDKRQRLCSQVAKIFLRPFRI